MKHSPLTTAAAALLLFVAPAFADEMEDLKRAFAARDAEVRELKTAGDIGESHTGYLEAPKSASSRAASLISAENTDRKRLFALIAAQNGATPEVVADRAARRAFTVAQKGDMLKYPDGIWRPKK